MSGNPPSFLITGATGFLGRHVIQAARREIPGIRLLALVRDTGATTPLDYMDGVELIDGSPLETVRWENDPRLDNIGGIIHLAAEVKHSRTGTGRMIRLNVDGTIAMVRLAAAKRCRMLYASTSGVVGCSRDPGHAPDEDAPYCDAVVSDWPYYASKIKAEREARALAESLGAELVIFRPPVLLGPGDHRFRSTGNILRLLRGRLPFIIEGTIHYVDVRDAAEAMVRALVHPHPGPVYHLTGSNSSLEEFFTLVAHEAKLPTSWRILPAKLLWYLASLNQLTRLRLHLVPDPVVLEMAQHHWGLSSRHAEADLGYRSRDPRETVFDTIKWIRSNRPDVRG